ncbi:hypothetical protein DIU31_031675 [Mucilaginibacter rubeus]|uniref:Zinc finger CHC2-type domain-containing protein n=1 Tax=Mucilaginibacter rubeus TaxID=2027860 RepID=A0AAE6JLR5_9SPHI|nr:MULTISPECIES: hypothetical protein [Mucilaginibacter]QEM07840.1 hypothetical protein DIU31_031675 [Mucilaginibacter rubeus]QEM20292.1 hypothetical protein DIU38_031280 [Mucilaginibacter gossypii]QTE42990.1 hypothetical protein J3L19_29385 [Mucilaginibacter rubeus]QTE49591.1 hypothetical protein J3L21_29345 [Mucilaginibacter rubeus]QTE54687.1 hypothetical protein J3L23_20970 [Mucilaginibacter rubeus]
MELTMNPTAIREQVSLTGLLARLGYQPAHNSGREILYRNVLHEDGKKPSLCVNDNLGMWYDHGTGKGGNVIDFGLAFWPGLEIKEVCGKLHEIMEQAIPAAVSILKPSRRKRHKTLIQPYYRVDKVCDLGKTPSIRLFLEKRGIWEEAQGILQEVHYHSVHAKLQPRQFFAAGHRNDSGSWQVRNKYFKGCLGNKGLTLLTGDSRRLCVFKDIFDYLSWKHDHPELPDSALIINSYSLLAAAIKTAMRYPAISVYFDHTPEGHQSLRQFITELPYAADGTPAFSGHHDYSEKRRTEARAAYEAQKPKDLFKNIEIPFIR